MSVWGVLFWEEAAGRGLVQALLMAKALPEEIRISGSRLQPVLQPLCDALRLELRLSSSLPALEEAVEALAENMRTGQESQR